MCAQNDKDMRLKPLVLITERLDAACADWLGEHAQVVWCPHDDDAALAKYLPDADGLVVRTYTQVDEALLVRAPKVKVIGRAGVGLDNFDLNACEKRGVQVVYTPDANTQAVVEYVTGLMLDDVRPRTPMPDGVSADAFHLQRQALVGRQLDELTFGVLGFGRIGKRIGTVAAALGMKVIVNDLLPEDELVGTVDYEFGYVDKKTLLAQSDVLTVHVDGRAENRNLINEEALSWMKPSAMLINSSRGMVVDAEALAQWAKQVVTQGGRAVLDVHEPEPPTSDYVLFGQSNVKLLSHLASRTETALANMSWVVKDVVAVLQGDDPAYPAF
jgi:phosphoglycerate dehydrogenase-like enzyme